MLQTKEQGKNLQDQINEEEIGNQPEKRIQGNDSKDNPKSQKQNGGTDRENTRNVNKDLKKN